jgi:hypothetical protein
MKIEVGQTVWITSLDAEIDALRKRRPGETLGGTARMAEVIAIGDDETIMIGRGGPITTEHRYVVARRQTWSDGTHEWRLLSDRNMLFFTEVEALRWLAVARLSQVEDILREKQLAKLRCEELIQLAKEARYETIEELEKLTKECAQ